MDVAAIGKVTQLLHAGHFLGAIAECRRALHAEPDCVPLLLLRVRAAIALGYTIDARADLRRVIELDPRCAAAYRLLGTLGAPRRSYQSTAPMPAVLVEPRGSVVGMRRFADGTVPDRGTSVPAARTAPAARFGRYDVFEKLGNGGMATVHRAEVMIDASADGRRRQVALKRLHAHLAEDRMFVEAFVDEARLASRLLHPNTVRAHELGKIDNTYYMAMEYVPGRTLAELATRRAPLAATVELLVQLCDALAFAHELRGEDDRPLGVIHRDVTPANVIVSREGVVKLIDFGIARSAMARHRTRTGIIKGKLAYVAPEYLSGSIDARGDLFGLGVIAHELLCGRRLFLLDDDLATLNNVCSGEVVAPSRHNAEVPPELDDIVLTALERDPDRRWQSARALGVALRGVARQLGVVVDGRHLRAWAFPAMAEGTRDPANEDLEPSIHVAALSPLRLPTEAFGPDPADWRDRRSARASRRG